MSYYSLTFILLFSISFTWARNPGDILWQTCQNITTEFVVLRDVCLVLTEAENCGTVLRISINGAVITQQALDIQITPEVCGTYPGCTFCVGFSENQSNSSQECVAATIRCPLMNPIQRPVGCFSKSILNGIEQCQHPPCPNNCSNEGNCLSGVCSCNSGYFGADCSSSNPISCVRLSVLSGNVCVMLTFVDCNIVVTVSVQTLPIFTKSYSITEFRSIFSQNTTCFQSQGCSICLGWDNLTLTENFASGCGSLSFHCGSMSYGPYTLGCFADNEIAPSCFGTCPNQCSHHGSCQLGQCKCDAGYNGDDCSHITRQCSNGCSTHGVCNQGVCDCNNGYQGQDCSIITETKKHSSTSIIIIIIVVGLVGIGALVFVGWYLRKRFLNKSQFNHFDLLVDDPPTEGVPLEESDQITKEEDS